MITVKCKIKYDPTALTGKAEAMFKPWWVIANIEGEMTDYYAWFVTKRTGIMFQRPAWGAHISIVRGEEPINKELWKKYDNLEVEMSYDPDVRTNGEHWWMRVECDRMLDLREELGLSRHGAFNLHMTLGRPAQRHEENSRYYHRFFANEP